MRNRRRVLPILIFAALFLSIAVVGAVFGSGAPVPVVDDPLDE